MSQDCALPLDGQAKWELIQEVERYEQKLRQLEVSNGDADEYRDVAQEHLKRVMDVYEQWGVRHSKAAALRPS